ncbi:hypothetical protein ACOME3_004619 [Neoechinorhynchus agilis]
MKTYLPQINWHDQDQISSCHFNPADPGELVTCGASPNIRIWRFDALDPGNLVTFMSEYTVHVPWINCVRFNSTGRQIGSCSDDATLCIVEKHIQVTDDQTATNSWRKVRRLRGHLQPVVDFAWSTDDRFIVSGSMDNILMVWNVEHENRIAMFPDATGGIVGVCVDPLGQYFCSQSTDRFLRLYDWDKLRLANKVCKVPPFKLPGIKTPRTLLSIFQGHDVASLNRRLCFTPDGQFLIATSCSCEGMDLPSGHSLSRSAAVFHRSDFEKPVAFLPVDPTESTKGVAAYPFKLKLISDNCQGFGKGLNLVYRLVVAVVTGISLIIFDSHQPIPLAYMTGAHYGDLSDVQWSSDGCALCISSLDGFMTLISFEAGEFGETYFERQTACEPMDLSE